MEYYVYITNDCNMNCAYCSVMFDTAKYGMPLHPQYSFEKLECFVTETQASLNDNVADIYFFGGEPTVDYNMINKLIKAFNRAHEYKINYIMHTNGLLIPDAPQEIIKNISLTILSFNYELIYENGIITPYLGKIINAIEYIRSIKKVPIIGRITVSPQTSLFTECCLIDSFVDYVYWQIDNCNEMADFNSYQTAYKRDIELLYKYWYEHFKKGTVLKFVPFISAIRNLIVECENPKHFYCGYGTSMIYVQTNGNCYACCDNVATNSHYIGNIFKGIKFANNELSNTICKDCEYIKLCGGRCGRMHKDFSAERVKEYCELNKFMFDLLKSNINEIEIKLRQNPDMLDVIMDPMLAYTEYTA